MRDLRLTVSVYCTCGGESNVIFAARYDEAEEGGRERASHKILREAHSPMVWVDAPPCPECKDSTNQRLAGQRMSFVDVEDDGRFP